MVRLFATACASLVLSIGFRVGSHLSTGLVHSTVVCGGRKQIFEQMLQACIPTENENKDQEP